MRATSARWLRQRAENIAVILMAVMFVTFLYQIVMRYFFAAPAAWAEEVCVMGWVWAVLWGTAFVTREDDDIRLDVVRAAVPPRARRIMDTLAGLALIVIFLIGLPGAWSYVTFMKIETTAALGWRFHWVFSIYILFALAIIVRQAVVVWEAITGRQRIAGFSAPSPN